MASYTAKSMMRPIGYQVRTKSGGHHFMMDEDSSAGGTDAGPNPVQYLLGSIGGCLTITAKSIAKQHGYQLDHFQVITNGETTTFPDGTSAITSVNAQVSFDCDLNDEEKQQFFAEVLRKCTIHKTLEKALPMDIRLVNR